MSRYSSFIRSIRIRYVSGLLIIAIAVGGILFSLNRLNAYQRNIDRIGANIVQLLHDLRNATAFADQMTRNWHAGTRERWP